MRGFENVNKNKLTIDRKTKGRQVISQVCAENSFNK